MCIITILLKCMLAYIFPCIILQIELQHLHIKSIARGRTAGTFCYRATIRTGIANSTISFCISVGISTYIIPCACTIIIFLPLIRRRSTATAFRISSQSQCLALKYEPIATNRHTRRSRARRYESSTDSHRLGRHSKLIICYRYRAATVFSHRPTA